MGGGRSLGARALLTLISVGPMSRGDLAERLGLSAATTTRTVRPLIEAGLMNRRTALTSVLVQLPYLLAGADESRLEELGEGALALSGQGLRDVTRIAASDPRLWSAIIVGNAGPVVGLLAPWAGSPWKVLSREELLEQVWGYRHAADTRLVNVHVQRLRSKIERDPERPARPSRSERLSTVPEEGKSLAEAILAIVVLPAPLDPSSTQC